MHKHLCTCRRQANFVVIRPKKELAAAVLEDQYLVHLYKKIDKVYAVFKLQPMVCCNRPIQSKALIAKIKETSSNN